MKLKHYVVFLIVIALVLGFFGCTTEKVSYEDDPDDMEQLTIYLQKSLYHYRLKYFIDVYNQKPDSARTLKIILFEDTQTMYDQLLDELMVGEGPDIIYIDPETHKYIDIDRIAKQDAFADMDILIEQDGAFDLEDYHALAMETGIVDGKRVMMPGSYTVLPMLGIKECFQGNGFAIPEKLTMNAYLSLLESYHEMRPQEPALLGIDPIYLLAEYITIGQPIEDSDELRRLFEVLKEENRRQQAYPLYGDMDEWCKRYLQDDIESADGYSAWVAYEKFFIENNLLLQDYRWLRNLFHALFEYNNIIRQGGGEMVMMQQPHKDDEIKAYIDDYYLININSKQKNKAFQFVKYMMSEDVNRDTVRGVKVPICKEGYTYQKDRLLEGYRYFTLRRGSNAAPVDEEVQLPQEMVNQLIAYVEGVEACESIGKFQYVYYNVIYEYIEEYYNDLIPYEQMIDDINNKLLLYCSE